MLFPRIAPKYARHLCCILTLLPLTSVVGNAQSASKDEADFIAARAQVDPVLRAQALEQFAAAHRSSDRWLTAQKLLLETYLSSFPERTEAIHTAASAQLQNSSPGLERWTEEVRLAVELADAGDHGLDLEDAQRWAAEAVQAMTEPAYRQQVQRERLRFHLPAMSARSLHLQFLHDRAEAETALAAVTLQQGHPHDAELLLDEARRLHPHGSEAIRLRAQIALEEHRPAAALSYLIQADALSPLPAVWRTREMALFEQLEHGDAEALDQRVDEAYRVSYPPLYHLPPRSLPAGGHAVLLELFTGSDCAPCAGPDLALDSLLDSYTRSDLIALELDLHVPQPDPLATPATMEQASACRVESTPSAFLDGEPLQILGTSRADVENIVVGFAEQIEEQAQLSSPVQLQLTSSWDSNGQLAVFPALAPTPGTSEADLPQVLQRAVVQIALAEDHLRYPGRNGVRFHRFVVRALQQTPAAVFTSGTSSQKPFHFDLRMIQSRQAAYLADFEQHNDRFGSFHFRQKDLPVDPSHLAVVAWVQDPVSRRVLQAAFASVPAR